MSGINPQSLEANVKEDSHTLPQTSLTAPYNQELLVNWCEMLYLWHPHSHVSIHAKGGTNPIGHSG